jgi:hypothetical protein
MKRTIDVLVEAVVDDLLPGQPAVSCDYFGGLEPETQEFRDLYSVYQGMIKILEVDPDMIELASKCGKLNELIHHCHQVRQSNYYKRFVQSKTDTSLTFLPPADVEDIEEHERYCKEFKRKLSQMKLNKIGSFGQLPKGYPDSDDE